MKTQFINQLPTNTRESIKSELVKALSQLDLSHSEYYEALDDALNSRLCDLSDTIDINKYL